MWNDLQSYFRMLVASLVRNEEGQAMVEYGLIIALVAVVAAVTLSPLGGAIAALFSQIQASL